jgi:hypothetical protein
MINNPTDTIKNMKKFLQKADNASQMRDQNIIVKNNNITSYAKESVDAQKKIVKQLSEMLNTKKIGPVTVEGPTGERIIAVITKGGIKFDFDNKYKNAAPNNIIFSELSISVIKNRVIENVPLKDTSDTVDNIFDKRLLRFKENKSSSDWITFILMNNIDDNNDSYSTSGKNLFITPRGFNYGTQMGTFKDIKSLVDNYGFQIADNNKIVENLIKNPQLLHNVDLSDSNKIHNSITHDNGDKRIEHIVPHWYLSKATVIKKTHSPNKLSFPFGEHAFKLPPRRKGSCVFQLLNIPASGEYNLSFYIYAENTLSFNINTYKVLEPGFYKSYGVGYGITSPNSVNGGWILNNIKLEFGEKNKYIIRFIHYSDPDINSSSVYLNNIVLNKTNDNYTLGTDNLESCQFKAHKALNSVEKYYGLFESTLSSTGDELVGKCVYGSTLTTPTSNSQLTTSSHIVLFTSGELPNPDEDTIMSNTNVLTFSSNGSLLLIDLLTKDNPKTAIYKTPIQNVSSTHKGFYLTNGQTSTNSNTSAAEAIDIALANSCKYVGLEYKSTASDKYTGNVYLIKDDASLNGMEQTDFKKTKTTQVPIKEIKYEQKAVEKKGKFSFAKFLKKPRKTTIMVDDLSKPYEVITGYKNEETIEDNLPNNRGAEPTNSRMIWGGDGEMSVYQVDDSSSLFNMVLKNSGLYIYDGLYDSKSKVMFQKQLTGINQDATNYYTPQNSSFYDSTRDPSKPICYFNSHTIDPITGIKTQNVFHAGDFLCSPNGKLALILTLDCRMQVITFGVKDSDFSTSGADLFQAPDIGNPYNYYKLAYIDMNGDANIYHDSDVIDSKHKSQVNKSNKYHTTPNMSYSGDVTFHKNDKPCKDICTDDEKCYGFIDDSDGKCYTMTKPYSWGNQIYKKAASLNIRQLNPSNNVLGDYGIDYSPANTINFPIKDFEKYNSVSDPFTNIISMKTLAPSTLGDVKNSRIQTTNMNAISANDINNNNELLNTGKNALNQGNKEMASLLKEYNAIRGNENSKEKFTVRQEGMTIADFKPSIDNIINNKNTVLLQQNYNYLLLIILTFAIFIILVIVLYIKI